MGVNLLPAAGIVQCDYGMSTQENAATPSLGIISWLMALLIRRKETGLLLVAGVE
jgi:hypothetical protein